MRKNRHYVPTPETIKHVDEVLKLMYALSKDERFLEVQESSRLAEKGDQVTMVDVITEYEERGEARGEARGLARGEARGKELGAAEALYGMGLSVDEIAKKMDKTPDEIQKLLQAEPVIAG